MAPNLDEKFFDCDDATGPVLFLAPLPEPPLDLIQGQVVVPLEQNLRGLLVKVTGTEELERATQVKLRVIARELPLQHLAVHMPALRELVMDGSVISTLRDLGCGLRNLKVLKVNRCSLICLDGMFGLEGLEELYAADNAIENPMPCAFLSNIRTIDLRRNALKNAVRNLGFLRICKKLEHIYLEGNDEIWQFPKYRQTVKSLLPALRSLDGIAFTEGEFNRKVSTVTDPELKQYYAQHSPDVNKKPLIPINGFGSPRTRPVTPDMSAGFTVTFPPKVFPNKPSTINK